MPSVIKFAIKKRLLTGGGGRNSHEGFTPNIGGIAIFVGLLFTNISVLTYYIEHNSLETIDVESLFLIKRHLIFGCSIILLFIIGLADDLTSLSSGSRFLTQIIVS